MQPIAAHVVYVVDVCLSVTRMYSAKTAEPIEMPFGVWARVSPRNRVLDVDPDPPRKGEPLGGFPAH